MVLFGFVGYLFRFFICGVQGLNDIRAIVIFEVGGVLGFRFGVNNFSTGVFKCFPYVIGYAGRGKYVYFWDSFGGAISGK